MSSFYSREQYDVVEKQSGFNRASDCRIECFKYSILVVDDTPLNLVIASKYLQLLGYKFGKAGNGVQGIRMVAEGSYDLVLMDCHMPKMDGYKATEAIRKLPEPFCNIPIIALTADASTENRNKCSNVGMNGFLEKPLQRDQLDGLIRKWIGFRGHHLLPKYNEYVL